MPSGSSGCLATRASASSVERNSRVAPLWADRLARRTILALITTIALVAALEVVAAEPRARGVAGAQTPPEHGASCALSFQVGPDRFRAFTRVDSDSVHLSIAEVQGKQDQSFDLGEVANQVTSGEIVRLRFGQDQTVGDESREVASTLRRPPQVEFEPDSRRCLVRDLQPGVDLRVYEVEGGVEYDLVVHYGTSPTAISIHVSSGWARRESMPRTTP